jgi:hypothetical protein
MMSSVHRFAGRHQGMRKLAMSYHARFDDEDARKTISIENLYLDLSLSLSLSVVKDGTVIC